ncbi:MAG: hypothetical protein QHJ34_10530 [bacterium]|jgi:hypothetical protein|nr:hypothetical protein [candidate division KSB1 bacterium]MDH7560648.1 hypothetical protein [bacterium]
MCARSFVLIGLLAGTILIGCAEKWPTEVPETLPSGTRLLPLAVGTSWVYRHTIYDSLPGAPCTGETVVWKVGKPVMLQGSEYLPLAEFFAVRETEEGLFFARVDTTAGRVLDELFFRTTARQGEHYTYTFSAPETTITYEIAFAITPVENGDCYFGATYAVTKVNGEEVRQGPAFLFRPGRYLKAIDRFPAPPFHFWALAE